MYNAITTIGGVLFLGLFGAGSGGYLFGGGDADGDSLVNAEDTCPSEAEDFDGYEDADGCPEPTRIRLVFTDPEGLIETVHAEVIGYGPVTGAGVMDVDLEPGEYELRALAPGYHPLVTRLTVQAGPAREVRRALARLPRPEVALNDPS